jgi:hypothetical protein
MQGIYSYIPETNHVSRVCSVATVFYLQFKLHVMLFRLLHTFCTFTLALSEACVQCSSQRVLIVAGVTCKTRFSNN